MTKEESGKIGTDAFENPALNGRASKVQASTFVGAHLVSL